MGFLSSTFAQTVLQVLFYLTVNCQAELKPILNVTKIKVGEPFTITCAANRVIPTTKYSHVTNLFGLGIYLDTRTHPYMMNIAQYHPSADEPNIKFINVTTSGWTVNFSGGDKGTAANRNTIRIEVVVEKAVCNDGGHYKCCIRYLNGGVYKILNKTDIVPAEAATTVPVLSLLSSHSNENSLSRYHAYDLGETVKMTCRVRGPPNLAIVWRREIRPLSGSVHFEDYPVQNDIATTSFVTSVSACSQFQYVSHFKFTISEQDVKRTYQCVIQAGGADSIKVSATIDWLHIGNLRERQMNDQSGDFPELFLTGCVVGSLIITGVVIYVVHNCRSEEGDDH